MMASPVPSEEERRLLREYRLTSVPSKQIRRDSALQTSINCIETTTPTFINNDNNIISNDNNNSIINNSGCNSNNSSNSNSSNSSTNITNGTNNTSNTNGNSSANNIVHRNGGNNIDSTTHNDHYHHHFHHNQKYHHIGRPKRHKNATLELTPDELNKMSELVSKLNHLELVPPTNGITTKEAITNTTRNPIFEKVDYIKKIRRKAIKNKLRRAYAISKIMNAIRGTQGLFDKLVKRSLIEKIYPESSGFREKLDLKLQKPTSIYAGFDATASSLHVGNLAVIMNLLHFQRHGHQVICVIGDATTQVGDPSGHTKDRKKLETDLIESNSKSIESILRGLFKNHQEHFSSPNTKYIEPAFVRNSEWYQQKNVVNFVSDIFREVRVGSLLHKKAISERLESSVGMNMSEFCYQIFQAYDWMELRRRYNCELQLGGSDQAGNIYTGHDLIKKIDKTSDTIGLLCPLIVNTRTGRKLGKTGEEKSSIWLDRKKTSPYELYQFFHRTPDSDVERFLKIFSLHDEQTIESIVQNHLKKPGDTWFCQRKLAEHVCMLVHGKDGLDYAKRVTHALHQKQPQDIARLSEEELKDLFDEKSVIQMMHNDDLTVKDLTRRAGCFKDDLVTQRLIEAGGLWLNGARVTSFEAPITSDLIIGNDVTIMRVGRSNYFLFKWTR